jgi:hypothetical protein
MSKIAIGFVATLFLILIGFGIGRLTLETKTIVREIPVSVNVNSLKNIWAESKVDSVNLDSLLASNEFLRTIAKRKPRTIHDTVLVSDSTLRSVAVFSMDTTKQVNVSARIIQDRDTSVSSTTSNIRLGVQFIGKPFNVFHVEQVSLSPFDIPVRVKEKIIVNSGSPYFSLHVLGGYVNDSPGLGAMVHLSNFGFGFMGVSQSKPVYLISYRLGSL